MKISVLIAILCMAIAGAAFAEKRGKEFSIGKITSKEGQAIIKSASNPRALRRKLDEVIPEFKVPADSIVRCRLFEDGVICGAVPGTSRCPDEIEMEIPGQRSAVEVPVDCVGPDEEGNCECEVASN